MLGISSRPCRYYIIIMICSFFFLKFWEKLCDISTPRCPLDNDQSATDGFGAKKAQVNFSNLVAVTSTVAAQQLARRAVRRGAGGSAQAAVAAIAVTSFRRNLRNYFGPNPSSERRSSVGEQQLTQTPGCVTFTPYTTLRSSALQPHARAAAAAAGDA